MTWAGAGLAGNSPIGALTINGGTLILKSVGLCPAFAGGGTNNIISNNATLVFDAPAQSDTNSRAILGTGQLRVNNGTLTLSGTNTSTGGTIISSGTLFIGAGGTSGSLGSGAVTNDNVLVFNRSNKVTVTNVISGAGSVVQQGSGTLLLNGVNTYTGATTISNGTFGGIGTLAGPVTLGAGTTLAPGASVGTLTINSDLNIGGDLAIEVDKSLLQSNDLVVVSGVLANSGTGTLAVSNLGPALATGDKFTLFNQPVVNGGAITVTGARANWANHLAVDGSISVVSLIPPPTLNLANSGASLQLSWTDGFNNFKLQMQTNLLGTNWTDYPGGSASPVTVPIDPTSRMVFFRLAPLP
jgi:autotransporter-associated beta strand protein